MRIKEVILYSFSELSAKGQQKAIDKWRENGIDTQHYWDEANESVKKFNDIFGTDEGRNSCLDVRTSGIDDNILNLKGLRLQKYIWNNYKNSLYKGKYYSTPGYYVSNNKYHYRYRLSKCQIVNSCVLTGLCWDESLLEPIYNFLNSKKWHENKLQYEKTTFQDLLTDCVESLKLSLESSDEYAHSDEAIIETIEANNYEFTEDGELA